MEGTTLGGKHHIGFETEKDVENEMSKLFANQKDVSFIISAGSNVDRTVSIYKAARRSGKILVIDLYTYHILNELKKLWSSLPPHKNDNIRVIYFKGHSDKLFEKYGKSILRKYYDRRIGEDEIVQNRENMVLRIPINRMKRLSNLMEKEKSLENSNFIFSMWQGYLEKDKCFEEFYTAYNLALKKIHTSGHAYIEDLKFLAYALNPKTLIPIHAKFQNLCPRRLRIG